MGLGLSEVGTIALKKKKNTRGGKGEIRFLTRLDTTCVESWYAWLRRSPVSATTSTAVAPGARFRSHG
jgi:hypothetical protein